MADEAPAAAGGETLLTGAVVETPTGGPEHTPDVGEGEGKPDEGEGEGKPDTGEADTAEEARRAAEDAAAEEARRAALTDEERAAEDAAREAETGAPDEYADFAVTAEGIELDADALGKFKEIAKADNLSQAKAQRYVDAAVELVTQQQDALADGILTTRQGWLDSTKTDKEIGGEKLPESLATAKRGLEAYGSPALTKLFDETGLGNHPEVIRAFAKAGATVAEDTIIGGKRVPNEAASTAKRLYPSMAD